MTAPTLRPSDATAPDRPALVEVRGLTRTFGAVTALSEVDLDLHEGGFHSLLGPSGCGKTTLLRILAGFEQPDHGDVVLDGRSLLRVPPHRRPTNIVFQRYALFSHLDVADNVAFGLTTGGGRRRKARSPQTRAAVAAALDLVGLPGYGERFPAQLSGGQAQRVALARALVRRPRLLLLDEPLSALDQNVRLAMRESLLEIQQSTGTTFLLVTHDQEEALSMSTSVALLNAGRVEQVGAPETLYQAPASVFAARFLGAGSMVRARVRSVEDGRAHVVAGAEGGVGWTPFAVDARPGAPGLVLLRPEELRLVGAAQARVAGTVSTAVFLGAAYEVRVATPVGTLRLRTSHGPVAGERVHVGWDEQAGRCFADPEPEEPR